MGNKKILIVEDDNFVAEVYMAKLAEIGYSASWACNGKEGLDFLDRDDFSLILLDVLMPVMNGMEMLDEINKNENWKKIPVILLTNVGEKDNIENARKFGARSYLIKSHFTPAEVIEKIESILSEQQKI
ncbi:MAG: response regulator [Candidatus Moranbacteria bacterium]|nr:response regulator [Candidatus Moranbacteria bacterium]